MTITKRIAVGARVEGKHGPLIDNPSGGKRQIRMKVFGTVLRATEKGEWEVRFDFDGRRKTVRNNTLKVVENDAGVPLDELSAAPTATATTVLDDTSNESATTATSNGILNQVCTLYFFRIFFLFLTIKKFSSCFLLLS